MYMKLQSFVINLIAVYLNVCEVIKIISSLGTKYRYPLRGVQSVSTGALVTPLHIDCDRIRKFTHANIFS